MNINYPALTESSKTLIQEFVNQLITDLSDSGIVEIVSYQNSAENHKLYWRLKDDVNEVGQWKELTIRSEMLSLSNITSVTLWSKSNSPDRNEIVVNWRSDTRELKQNDLYELNTFIERIYTKVMKQKLEEAVKERFGEILEQCNEETNTNVSLYRNKKRQIYVYDAVWNDEPVYVVPLSLRDTVKDCKISELYLIYRQDENKAYTYLGVCIDILPFYQPNTRKYLGHHCVGIYPNLSVNEVKDKLEKLIIPADIDKSSFEFNNRGMKTALLPSLDNESPRRFNSYLLLEDVVWEISVFHRFVKKVQLKFSTVKLSRDSKQQCIYAHWKPILNDKVKIKGTFLQMKQEVYLEEGMSLVETMDKYTKENALKNIEALLNFFSSISD